eukprot:TRINITY_DN18104_c0_g1_i1.p1 TRINITY_DN18104_c0_g1~~TRINITY_DN18104_c0_g1_i1.p1  ORF type:complete len:1439 (+),score=223.58 TRINITY_DN18104_c0_g1_i1:100-4317(+)
MYDGASDGSDGQDESFCLADDEVMMLRNVDWDVIQHHATYEGRSPLLELLGDVTDRIRVGVRQGDRWPLWVRQPGRQLADIHSVSTTVPKHIVDSDNALDTTWIMSELDALPMADRCILWTLLKLEHPSLLEVQEATPTVGSWHCTCGHLNVGFKAKCEVCQSHPPAGWWKKDIDNGPKLPSLDGVAIPRLAPHAVLHITWDRQKVGWKLRNDDLVVLGVDAGGAAEQCGLRPGMRIVAVDNKVTTCVTDVRDALNTAPSTFELTVSIEPVTRLKPATSLTDDDGLVVVVLRKQPHERMGTHWHSSTNLTLTAVDRGTPADLAGLSSLIGWRLTHINTRPVNTSDDIIQEAMGQGVLPLYWARPTPGLPVGYPKIQAKSDGVGQGVAPMVSTFAPSVLWVIAPKKVQHCGGLYRLQNVRQNDRPVWKHAVNNQILYSSAKGLWCVSDSTETGHGWIFSMKPSSLGMPDSVSEWEAMGQPDPSIKVVSTLPIPGLLKVDAGRSDAEQLRGTYTLIRDAEDNTLPFKVVNGMPAWKSVDKERWVYSNSKGIWVVTDDAKDFSRGGGVIFSTVGHGGIMPYEIRAWHYKNGIEKSDFRVTIGGGADEENEPPKANMTATVHENAVWGYQDLGNFSLAKHLHQLNSNYSNLLWISGENPRCGWLGIDLSNEEGRGQLVRILTELVDQESIQVRQPVVAGVTVKAAHAICTPSGLVIEAGTTGQVISVVMSRTPVGNAPPRMAKVNFNGISTVTVSYGDVWPVQSTFDRGAKVRVLAVDAVAVVDSETTMSNGVGVRGKYRVKYATGKTYHVRNFALINADKPWGEGDEVATGASEFKEGTKIQLATDMVFSDIDALPKGTVGIVTNFGQEVEVLAGGLLFKAYPDQLEVAQPQIAKGDLVSPSIYSGLPQDSWESGRVQEIANNEFIVQTPNRVVKTPDVRGMHFALGQPVYVKGSHTGEWELGLVVKVLRDGSPFVSVKGRPGRKYWFVRHMWEATPNYHLRHVTQVEGGIDDDECDPLVSMESYITMNPSMLREAENMRRRWIEHQRTKDAIYIKLSQMANASEVRRSETRHHALLRRSFGERMGTDFYSRTSLLLTSVAEGSAAQKCGLGRFVGRLLSSIDGVYVQTTDHVRAAAEGKLAMTLGFEKTPLCVCGACMVIRLTAADGNQPGVCPGCLKMYGDAYFSCRECHRDVCGKCGEESRLSENNDVGGHGQAQATASAEATAAAMMQQQQMMYQMQVQQMQQQLYARQQQQQGSWGQAALSGELDPTTKGWGSAQIEQESHDDGVNHLQVVQSQPVQMHMATSAQQVPIERPSERFKEPVDEEEEEPVPDFNFISMIDSVISPQDEEAQDDPLGLLNLSTLLSKVNGLPTSPPASPMKAHEAQLANLLSMTVDPWAAIEKKSY